jgi:signal transduction histidine kinase
LRALVDILGKWIFSEVIHEFHRGRNTAQTLGSDLGLAIVKRIIDLHHGTIHAKTSDEGTDMYIELPGGLDREV